jgi:hypothetical protein
MLVEFMCAAARDNPNVKEAVIRDNTAPWHGRVYYALASLEFNVKLMWLVDSPGDLLNSEVKDFLENPGSQVFQPAEVPAKSDDSDKNGDYADLRCSFDSREEERGQREEHCV